MPKPRKYRNEPTVVAGQRFDSKAEAHRYLDLRQLQGQGVITELRRQVIFELVPGVRLLGAKRATPALRFVADFTYTVTKTGLQVVEDVKGMRTPVYRIKRHLMKALLGIDVLET